MITILEDRDTIITILEDKDTIIPILNGGGDTF